MIYSRLLTHLEAIEKQDFKCAILQIFGKAWKNMIQMQTETQRAAKDRKVQHCKPCTRWKHGEKCLEFKKILKHLHGLFLGPGSSCMLIGGPSCGYPVFGKAETKHTFVQHCSADLHALCIQACSTVAGSPLMAVTCKQTKLHTCHVRITDQNHDA